MAVSAPAEKNQLIIFLWIQFLNYVYLNNIIGIFGGLSLEKKRHYDNIDERFS